MWAAKGANANARPAVRVSDWKYYHYNDKKTGPMLYDLAKDPGEKRNLVKEKPQVVRRLSNQIKDWIATLPKEYTKPNKQKKRDKKK